MIHSDSDNGAAFAARRQPVASRLRSDIYRPENKTPSAFCISYLRDGDEYHGSGHPEFTIRVASRKEWRSIERSGTYGAALAFVNGQIEIDGDLIAAVRWWNGRGGDSLWNGAATQLRFALHRVFAMVAEPGEQSRKRAATNIRFHYDQPVEFYRCFLDANLVYSCAYFEDPEDSIEEAQIAKLEHICRKLELNPSDRFLDIGCGWGGLVLHAARRYSAEATGCTLSPLQYEFASRRAMREGWTGRANFLQRDYRDLSGSFDKIASIGMFEHVGRRYLPGYFRGVSHFLKDDGLFLNHGLIRPQAVAEGSETLFLRRHVFPGSELPHLTEVVRMAEDAGFEVLDIESLRPHYALTCRAWVSRLRLSEPVAIKLAGAQIYRTWLLYLSACAASFDQAQMDVYQVLMSKRRSQRARHLTRLHMGPPPR